MFNVTSKLLTDNKINHKTKEQKPTKVQCASKVLSSQTIAQKSCKSYNKIGCFIQKPNFTVSNAKYFKQLRNCTNKQNQ